MEENYTPEDVAEKFLKIPVKSVHDLCRAGKLRYFRANGRHKVFTPEMIREYIEAQTVNTPKRVDKKDHDTVTSTPNTQRIGGKKSFGSSRTELLEELRS